MIGLAGHRAGRKSGPGPAGCRCRRAPIPSDWRVRRTCRYAVQSIWETGLRAPANLMLAAVSQSAWQSQPGDTMPINGNDRRVSIRVGFDIDGVIANFNKTFRETAAKIGGLLREHVTRSNPGRAGARRRRDERVWDRMSRPTSGGCSSTVRARADPAASYRTLP